MDSTCKIPKPSGLRPPTKLAFSTSKELPALPTFSNSNRVGLRRRSKSVTDLRNNVKPLVPLNINPLRDLTKATSSISLQRAPKRTAPEVKKPEIKPKVARATVNKPTTSKVEKKENKPATKAPPKRAKPAPYDYKARFNLLSEKHELLKTALANAKEQLGSSATVHEENIELKAKNENLEREFACATNQNHLLEAKCEALTLKSEKEASRIQDLEGQLSRLEEKYEKASKELTAANETLKVHNRTLLELEELKQIVAKCKAQIQQDNLIRRALHNQVQDLKGNIRVFCRVRPPLPSEMDRMECNITYTSECSLEIRKAKESISANIARNNDLSQEFVYDQIFGPKCGQAELFEELSQLVQSALDGYHVCIFAYGQTGSGKTYTMQGDSSSQSSRGMIPRSIECLFQRIAELKDFGWDYEVHASFLEIYNENIRDLLNSSFKQTHDIRYNEGKGVTVTNLQIEPISSEYDLKILMNTAEKNRSVAATNYNEHSSRSHAVTKIYLKGVHSESETTYIGSLNLVDLAGSECAKTSGTDRIAETKHINKSLAALGNVMLALHNKACHIPYRDSKLTYLLQSCLGGNSKTLMIVNIAPFEDCYQESMSSLRFAAKVKEVKNNFRRNKT